jgi:hypothetical protein
MMKRIIEQVGTWSAADGSGADAELNGLIERVQKVTGGNPAAIRDALEAAVRKDNLICDRMHGRVAWRWRDFL